MLMLTTSMWGQVGTITNIANTTGGAANRPRPTTTLPDSTATSGDTLSDEGLPKGIEYHVDIPDSVLQASIFLFHRQPMQVKIMALEHP